MEFTSFNQPSKRLKRGLSRLLFSALFVTLAFCLIDRANAELDGAGRATHVQHALEALPALNLHSGDEAHVFKHHEKNLEVGTLHLFCLRAELC